MSKIYYLSDAQNDVYGSINWEVGRKVSLEKWREIRRNKEDNYSRSSICGFCIVAGNRKYEISPRSDIGNSCGNHCPANKICAKVVNYEITSARRIIRMIKDLKIKKGS